MTMPSEDLPGDQPAKEAMFRRIVLALDGSPVAEQALPYAEAWAKLADAPLHVVRVFDPLHPGTPLATLLAADALALELWVEGERVATQEYLEHLHQGLQGGPVSVTAAWVEGPTVETLLAITRPGDLLVMATHGRGGPARWFLGSTAERVLRQATVPVFLVRANEAFAPQPGFQRLVVPLDGSAGAEAALPMARALATRLHIPVHLVHVLELSGSAVLDFAVSAISADRLQADVIQTFTEAERHLAHAVELIASSGIPITTDLLYGEPALAITNATEPGDVIVMTTHGRTGPARWLLGSVAEGVLRRSRVPVLLMRVAAERPTA